MNMQNDNEARMRRMNSSADSSSRSVERSSGQEAKVLTPAQFAREVLGVQAPFGFDRMPTVFG